MHGCHIHAGVHSQEKASDPRWKGSCRWLWVAAICGYWKLWVLCKSNKCSSPLSQSFQPQTFFSSFRLSEYFFALVKCVVASGYFYARKGGHMGPVVLTLLCSGTLGVEYHPCLLTVYQGIVGRFSQTCLITEIFCSRYTRCVYVCTYIHTYIHIHTWCPPALGPSWSGRFPGGRPLHSKDE